MLGQEIEVGATPRLPRPNRWPRGYPSRCHLHESDARLTAGRRSGNASAQPVAPTYRPEPQKWTCPFTRQADTYTLVRYDVPIIRTSRPREHAAMTTRLLFMYPPNATEVLPTKSAASLQLYKTRPLGTVGHKLHPPVTGT